MFKAQSEDMPLYYGEASNDAIRRALTILEGRLRQPGQAMHSPETVKAYLTLHLAELEHEMFCCLWLDAQNRMIDFEEMFRGTVTQTSVYPREIVKAALKLNAAAVIFAHNHPSGMAEPSRADEALTQNLKTVLALIEVRVLDHIIVAGTSTVSFAERGLI